MCVQKGETKIFYFVGTKMRNNFFVYIWKRETATNHTPVYTFGLGYPPQDKHKIIHNLKT